jgi:hypothetical protein
MFFVGYIGAPPTITVFAFWAETVVTVPALNKATMARENKVFFI